MTICSRQVSLSVKVNSCSNPRHLSSLQQKPTRLEATVLLRHQLQQHRCESGVGTVLLCSTLSSSSIGALLAPEKQTS